MSAAEPSGLEVPPVEPLADEELPRCSIVVLNWNGKHHLDGCFGSLDALDYPNYKHRAAETLGWHDAQVLGAPICHGPGGR